MRINREIDADVFAAKQTELRDRIANLKLQLDVIDRSHDAMCDLAVKTLSQRGRLGADTCHYERVNSISVEAHAIKALTRRPVPGGSVQTVRACSLPCSPVLRKSHP